MPCHFEKTETFEQAKALQRELMMEYFDQGLYVSEAGIKACDDILGYAYEVILVGFDEAPEQQ